MKVEVELHRAYKDKATYGDLYIDGVLQAKTLELPDHQNEHSISCIPEGNYEVVREKFTEKHPYPHFRVLNVKDRQGILWHKITYVKDLRGCIGIGGRYSDLNHDGVLDVLQSGVTLQKLYDMLPDKFTMTIKKA